MRKDYISYVINENIKMNDMAKMVKLADRIHNLSESSSGSFEFQEKYIKETTEWFIDLAKGTVFEEELNIELNKLILYHEKQRIEL